MNKKQAIKELREIPGVGKKVAEDFLHLGIHSVEQLKNRDPEELYYDLCDYAGLKVDRCMLYVFRCAVYYASNKQHDPELLKWWNWKDK